jgi:PAS domain S-box-containing protein
MTESDEESTDPPAAASEDTDGRLGETRRLADAVRRSPDPVAVKDRKGRYVAVNDRFCSLFGANDAVGRTDEDLFDPDDAACFRAADRRVIDAETPQRDEERVTVDDRELVFETTRVPHYEDGEVAGTATVRRDVTDRVERERELRRKNERLDTFASVVSHDLRNPLDIAEGYVGKARSTGAEEDFDEIESAIERSKAIVDELLTLARADRQLSDTETVDLAAVAETAWNGVDTDGATVAVAADRTVEADESQLKRVFENLFRNSVEHAGDGVTVRVLDAGEGFAVVDDGSGIPAEKREAALEPGYTTGEDGTGLGLAIVGRIAEAHGWTMELSESAEGGLRVDVTTA